MGKLKNGKAAGEDEVTGEKIKGEGSRMLNWIWSLCNVAFKSDVVLKDWRGERNSMELEFKNLYYFKNKLTLQEFFTIYMLLG